MGRSDNRILGLIGKVRQKNLMTLTNKIIGIKIDKSAT